ncbi:MAG: hypothetical protein MJK18_14720, partial [Bdellovibrionales bacterium]|nr:hypothetical protein [Bdellovibrionales bacterium]
MCDEGRDIYNASNPFVTEFVGDRDGKKTVKRQNRQLQAVHFNQGQVTYKAAVESVSGLASKLGEYKKAALVVTGQYSNEEYNA